MTCKDFYNALAGTTADEFRYVDKNSGRDAAVSFFGSDVIQTPAVVELRQLVAGWSNSSDYINARWNADGSTVILEPVSYDADPGGVDYAVGGANGNFLISGRVC